MWNLWSNNPAKFHAIWKIVHVSVTYVGEKTPISDHRETLHASFSHVTKGVM